MKGLATTNHEIFGVVFQLTQEHGALVVVVPYSSDYHGFVLRGGQYLYIVRQSMQVSAFALDSSGYRGQPYYAVFNEYSKTEKDRVMVALFPLLPVGNYEIEIHLEETLDSKSRPITVMRKITVYPGLVSEIRFK